MRRSCARRLDLVAKLKIERIDDISKACRAPALIRSLYDAARTTMRLPKQVPKMSYAAIFFPMFVKCACCYQSDRRSSELPRKSRFPR